MNNVAGDNNASVITINSEEVACALVDAPIPWGDIEGTAKYAYNWKNAVTELKDHKSHIIVSFFTDKLSEVEQFKILTSVICAVLKTTTAIGVYKGLQSLLIPKDDYLNQAIMHRDSLPINLWIYIGLRSFNHKKYGYTYGLTTFGKKEMEIIDSNNSLKDIRELLLNIAHYVLQNDLTFRNNETVGYTIDQKIKITISEGRFVKGDSYKLEY